MIFFFFVRFSRYETARTADRSLGQRCPGRAYYLRRLSPGLGWSRPPPGIGSARFFSPRGLPRRKQSRKNRRLHAHTEKASAGKRGRDVVIILTPTSRNGHARYTQKRTLFLHRSRPGYGV